jgi:O-antigen/teichoic acid export membrane protein
MRRLSIFFKRWINLLNKFKPKSEFSKNVLTLMTGTTIAQAIPIAISPILTRLYTPEDFGIFALFISIVSIFGSIANGRYELTIMLPKKDEDAINIFALGFLINIIISFFLLIIIIIFHDKILNLLNNEEISLWLYLVPFSVFLIGFFNLLTYLNNRFKNYKILAKANIMKSIIISIIQISVGVIKHGVFGLISGQIVSFLFINIKLSKYFNIYSYNFSFRKMFILAKKYKDFPKYSVFAVLANNLARNLLNILINSFYNTTTLGFYLLVQKVLGTPSAIIGNSIGRVFFQEATKERHLTGKAINTFYKTVKKLFIFSIVFFGMLYIVIEDLFRLVFGEKWEIAGVYAKILIPLYFINFISAPLDEIMNVFEKQKIILLMNLILLFANIVLFIMSKHFNIKFINFLYIYSYTIGFIYSIFLFCSFLVVKGKCK